MSPDLARFAEEALGFRVVGEQVVFRRPGSGWSHLPSQDIPPRPGCRPATPQECALWRLLVTPQAEWGGLSPIQLSAPIM
jgi:hypothetical protein